MGNEMFGELLAKVAGRHPVLTREEEIALVAKAQLGDRHAEELLVRHNLRFIFRYAYGFNGRGASLEDLVQEALVGFTIGVKKFKPEVGVKLITYAIWWMRAQLSRHTQASQCSVVRSPANKITLNRQRDISLSEPSGSDTDATIEDTLADGKPVPEEQLQSAEWRTRLRARVRWLRLSMVERDILEQRVMKDDSDTLEVIARRFALSRERIRQIEKKLVATLGEKLAEFEVEAA